MPPRKKGNTLSRIPATQAGIGKTDWKVLYAAPGLSQSERDRLADTVALVMPETTGFQTLPDILRRLEAQGLDATVGMILEAIRSDVVQREEKGLPQRFRIGTSGDERLIRWLGTPVLSRKTRRVGPAQTQPRRPAKQALRKNLLEMSPFQFEQLIATLLRAMGLHEVVNTPPSRDNGIDIRGVLIIENVIRVAVAVQVKRHKGNIHSPDIQKLRGSLVNGEVGWFFTAGDFSQGARLEAVGNGKQPISLISGAEIVDLLVKYNVTP